jgi:hypothetical protein
MHCQRETMTVTRLGLIALLVSSLFLVMTPMAASPIVDGSVRVSVITSSPEGAGISHSVVALSIPSTWQRARVPCEFDIYILTLADASISIRTLFPAGRLASVLDDPGWISKLCVGSGVHSYFAGSNGFLALKKNHAPNAANSSTKIVEPFMAGASSSGSLSGVDL